MVKQVISAVSVYLRTILVSLIFKGLTGTYLTLKSATGETQKCCNVNKCLLRFILLFSYRISAQSLVNNKNLSRLVITQQFKASSLFKVTKIKD